MSEDAFISIIIPTKNSGRTLEKVLKSIKEQTFKKYEIIIVDAFSTDNTIEIAKKYNTIIYQLPWERSSSINYAVKHSRGNIIYILGSDYVLVGKNILKTIVNFINEKGCDALVIDNLPQPINNWARIRLLERLFLLDKNRYIASRIFKKQVFLAIGGYRSELVLGEDIELHSRLRRAGYKICRVPPTTGREYHIGEPRSFVELTRKLAYYSKYINRLRKYLSGSVISEYNTLSVLPHIIRRPYSRYLLHFIIYNYFKSLYMIIGMSLIKSDNN